MTCCSCNAKCSTSRSGLCRLCREESHRPQLARRLRTRAAEHWTEGENEVLLIRSKLTQRQAVDRSLVALWQMEKLFDRKTIYFHGLDNPYMEEHARRTVVGYILASAPRRAKKKPVQSERMGAPARKQAA